MHKLTSKKRILLVGSISVVLLGTFILTGAKQYQQRPGSIHGRLLIWRCTIGMIGDNPLLGVGTGNFKSDYMHYQARFINENQNDNSAHADNTIFGFNEYLETASETGIPGLFLFLLIPLSVFIRVRRNWISVIIAKAGIISLMVFAMFSYPKSVLPLKVLFVIFIAIIADNQNILLIVKAKYLKTPGLLVLPVLCVAALVITIQLTKACIFWQAGRESIMRSPDELSIGKFNKAYPILKDNGFFINDYASTLVFKGKYKDAIKILKEGILIMPNVESYLKLGDCYRETGQFAEAESEYKYARYLLPARAQPVLELAKLYINSGREMEAITLIDDYFGQNPKQQYPATHSIENELRIILNDLKHKPQRTLITNY